MAVQPTAADPAGEELTTSDAALDASSLSDTEYLAKLGYKQELKRDLGLFSAFGVQFSSIAVTSAMFTTLIVGLAFFGPASFWSWVIGGTLQVFAVGLAVAELVSAYPLAGGVYQINNRILGQAKSRLVRRLGHPVSWQSGWWIVTAHTVSTAAVAWSMVPFVAEWFGINNLSSAQSLWWALGITILASVINLVGVRAAATMNNIGVLAEIGGALLVIVALLVIHHHTQPASILTNTAGTVVNHQWFKPLLFAFILPAYIISSFDSTGNAAEETHDAARKAPLGVFLANAAAWVTGIVFIYLLFTSIPSVHAVMSSAVPVKVILDSAVGQQITTVFQAVAVVALLATCTMLQLTGARVLWSQARDGHMPFAGFLGRVSRQRVPFNATVVAFGMSVIFLVAASFSATALAVLAGLTSLSWALAYGLVVCTGLYGLVTDKLPHRPFNCGRFSVVVFIAAVLWSVVICTALVWQNPSQVGGGMLGAIVVGAIIYAFIPKSRRRRTAALSAEHAAAQEAGQ
jgi:amino acid transporter